MTILKVQDVYGDRYWIGADDYANKRIRFQVPLRSGRGNKYSDLLSFRHCATTIHRENIESILERIETVSDSGTVSPMILGAFWIVPAVWLLMHFAVLQVVASFGR